MSEIYKNDRANVKFNGFDQQAKKERIAKLEAVNFPYHYQNWYTRCVYLLSQILPDRVNEFDECYRRSKSSAKVSYDTYTVSDHLIGLAVTIGGQKVFDNFSAFAVKFRIQLGILRSASERLAPRVKDIEAMLQSELFREELDAAQALLKHDHLRASGALAGVTLEAHLSRVASSRKVAMKKKSPAISDYNDELKSADIYDVPMWRLIQRLGDIRNYCVHKKERDPTKDEVGDLVVGVKKVISEVS